MLCTLEVSYRSVPPLLEACLELANQENLAVPSDQDFCTSQLVRFFVEEFCFVVWVLLGISGICLVRTLGELLVVGTFLALDLLNLGNFDAVACGFLLVLARTDNLVGWVVAHLVVNLIASLVVNFVANLVVNFVASLVENFVANLVATIENHFASSVADSIGTELVGNSDQQVDKLDSQLVGCSNQNLTEYSHWTQSDNYHLNNSVEPTDSVAKSPTQNSVESFPTDYKADYSVENQHWVFGKVNSVEPIHYSELAAAIEPDPGSRYSSNNILRRLSIPLVS